MLESLKIPDERKAVLIGKDGKVKRGIEESTKTKILVLDTVDIKGHTLDVMRAVRIVKAIGRGFSPESALLLLDEDSDMSIIELNMKDKQLKRTVARIIGTRGRTRKSIETLSGSKVSIYGKTVCIIGKADEVEIAENAIKLLIKGKSHSFVYGRLKRFKREGGLEVMD